MRHYRNDPRVQRIRKLLLREANCGGDEGIGDSVNRICKRLNIAIGNDPKRRIFPNRLWGFLCEDEYHAVNTRTLDTIEEAVNTCIERETPMFKRHII